MAVATCRALEDADDPSLSTDFQHLRWFPLPGEIQGELKHGVHVDVPYPLHPRKPRDGACSTDKKDGGG